MKKLIATLLALALCLGLCACGSNTDECKKCEDYEDLIEYLEDEKYDRAVRWILELAMEKEEKTDPPHGEGEDPALEEKYTQLVCDLEELETSLKEGWDFSVYYTPEGSDETAWLYGNDAYLYLYEQLTALGDYKDSQDLAARFAVLDDVLLTVTGSYTDALGNVNEDTVKEGYVYNTDGVLVKGPAPEEFEDLFWGEVNYEYDDGGRLICLRNVEYDGTVQAILDISYNADGTLAAIDFKDADGKTLTRSYVYEDGLLTQCNITDSSYSEPNFIEIYAYNAAGQLERVEKAPQELDGYDYIALTLYTYNADGTVATKRTSSLCVWSGELDSENSVHLWSYTYDGQGKLLAALDVDKGEFDAEGNPVESHTEFDRTYTYNYGPYCVYTPVN